MRKKNEKKEEKNKAKNQKKFKTEKRRKSVFHSA